MKGLERITNIRLAEVLTQKGHVTREEMSEVIVSQESSGESFVNVLVSMGYLTEWDLARLVSEYFQLPFMMAGNYETQMEVVEVLEEDFLFEHMVVPLDRFGKVMTLAIPVFLPGEVIQQIQDEKSLEVFPLVSLHSENKKKLQTLYPEHKIVERKPKPMDQVQKSDWESIFDIGDEAVKQELGS